MAEDNKKTDERPLNIDIDDSDAANRGLLDGQQQPSSPMASPASVTNNPVVAVLSYCGSSILMTTTNKYVMSGVDFNLSFFLLCIQVRAAAQASKHVMWGAPANQSTVRRLCCCDRDVQAHWSNHIP